MIEIKTDLSFIKSNDDEIAKINYNDWASMKDGFPLDRIKAIKNTSKLEEKWKVIQPEGYFSCLDVALINGVFYKINGIIRKKLWETEALEKPTTVIIHISKLSLDKYEAIVDTLYPLSARNKSQDIILRCYKKHRLIFNSDRLRHGYISDALNIVLRSNTRTLQDKRTLNQEINIDHAIKVFKNELIIIDNFNPDKNIFLTGILAAALLMISIDKNNTEFFIKLSRLEGSIKHDSLDPVEALLRAIEVIKERKTLDGKIQVEICSKAVKAVNLWKLGESSNKYWVKRLSSVVFLAEIRKMKQIKNILHEREL